MGSISESIPWLYCISVYVNACSSPSPVEGLDVKFVKGQIQSIKQSVSPWEKLYEQRLWVILEAIGDMCDTLVTAKLHAHEFVEEDSDKIIERLNSKGWIALAQQQLTIDSVEKAANFICDNFKKHANDDGLMQAIDKSFQNKDNTLYTGDISWHIFNQSPPSFL